MDEFIKKRAKKVVDAGMNISLAELTEAIQINEKLDALLSKELKIPDEIDFNFTDVEYVKGEKGDMGEKGDPGEKGEDGYTPVKGVDYFDGNDYILTQQDKKEIAEAIKVPVVEKVIEKIEVTKSKPEPGAISFIIDSGDVISKGIKGDMEIPFNAEIQEITMISDDEGTISVDILKSDFKSFPNSISIFGNKLPSIISNIKSKTILNKKINKGDILTFDVVKCIGVKRLLISLTVTKHD